MAKLDIIITANTSLAALGLIFVYLSLQQTWKGIPPEQAMIFSLYSRYREYFPNNLPVTLTMFRGLSILFGSLLVTGFLLWLETSPIVWVTGFYASTLFLSQVFEGTPPSFEVEYEEQTEGKTPDEVNWIDSQRSVYQIVKVYPLNNVDNKEILTVFRVYDLEGYPLSDWQKSVDSPQKMSDTDNDYISPSLHIGSVDEFGDLSSNQIRVLVRVSVKGDTFWMRSYSII